MRNYLLIMNGAPIADYFTKGVAQSAFARHMHRVTENDVLCLYELSTGKRIASNV